MKQVATSICFFFWMLFSQKCVSQEIGVASFYNDYFHGKTTASGQVFDNNAMTCAHKSLPFGTMLKVTNMDNERSVIVTVNDRGPYIKGRVLDLTRAAAKALGFINAGTARVMYEYYVEVQEPIIDTTKKIASDSIRLQTASVFMTLTPTDSSFYDYYGIKIATFETSAEAMKAANTLVKKYKIPTHLEEVQLADSKLFRVFLGSFANKAEAEKIGSKTKKNYPESYVIQYRKLN